MSFARGRDRESTTGHRGARDSAASAVGAQPLVEREGAVERDPFERVQPQRPAHRRGIAGVAGGMGGRTPSEIPPWPWCQVDRAVGETRAVFERDPVTGAHDRRVAAR